MQTIIQKSFGKRSFNDLPEDYENIGGIWLFFRAYKKDGYSGDQYFGRDSASKK